MSLTRKADVATSNPIRRIVWLRSVVAQLVIAALLLPTVFSLTSADTGWVLGVSLTSREPGEHATAHHREAADHGKEYSDIPGASGHPADHNCTPCQVLKSLVSYLPQLPLSVPSSTAHAAPSSDRTESQRARQFAFLPPSRAPPPAAV